MKQLSSKHRFSTQPGKLRSIIQRNLQWITPVLVILFVVAVPATVLAQDTEASTPGLVSAIDNAFSSIVGFMAKILFFSIGGFPLIVLWLFVGAIFFTVRMGFINIRAFKHAIDVVRGKYDDPNDEGEVSHFQALATALSGTVGLGNIAGVAVAIELGGPGAMFWLTLAGLFGMTSKFVECTLGVKYRIERPDGTVAGGPMYTLSRGLAGMGMAPLGRGLAVLFSVLCILGSLGGANMFQSNQAYAAVAGLLPGFPNWVFGLILAALVAGVIIGGIRRIGAIAGTLVPAMAVIYVLGCLWIILANLGDVPAAITTVVTEAFSPRSVTGGMVGVMVQGIRRSTFSNEAGIGSAAIAHSAARTDEPVREGIVALLEPFIDTVVICNMTAIVLVLTGAYLEAGEELGGVQLTLTAFSTISSWYPVILIAAIFLFAFSTIISWSYYGEISWGYLFGQNTVIAYKVLYVVCVFIGAIVGLGAVIDFSDLSLLSMAVPNLIGCYFLSGQVAGDLKAYMDRLRSGEMLTYEQQLASSSMGADVGE
ncbi:MAG: alanine:cation symporter family protein [Synechococcales cyanobacterium T60_A2020_003]|nr:alanine:cation symporter family protein [Synechococcales cyanobacterium T60_A2020_003]